MGDTKGRIWPDEHDINQLIDQLAQREPRFTTALQHFPQARKQVRDLLIKQIQSQNASLDHDAVIYHLQFWLHHYVDFGMHARCLWDDPMTVWYERTIMGTSEALIQHVRRYVKNLDELVNTWDNALDELLERSKTTSTRILCNHATWYSQGIIALSLIAALRRRYGDQPLDRLPFQFAILVGPAITTMGVPMIAGNDLTPLAILRLASHVIKTLPATENAVLPEAPTLAKRLVRHSLKTLRNAEKTPGIILLEAPSGRADFQMDGKLFAFPPLRAALRPPAKGNEKILGIALDERDLFDRGFVDNATFAGGNFKEGHVHMAIPQFHDINRDTDPVTLMESIMAPLKVKGKRLIHIKSD